MKKKEKIFLCIIVGYITGLIIGITLTNKKNILLKKNSNNKIKKILGKTRKKLYNLILNLKYLLCKNYNKIQKNDRIENELGT